MLIAALLLAGFEVSHAGEQVEARLEPRAQESAQTKAQATGSAKRATKYLIALYARLPLNATSSTYLGIVAA